MPKRGASATKADEHPVSPPRSKRPKTKVESTVTSKAVNSFFTPASQKGPEKLTWRVVGQSLLVGRYKPESAEDGERAAKRRKVAAFDFDFTLITTSSGNVFGKSPTDWKWWDACVPARLRKLHADGYQITIVSNQGGLNLAGKEQTAAKTRRVNDFKTKVGFVLAQLDLPVSIYAASGRDVHRKPRPGMWRVLLDDHALDAGDDAAQGVDLASSFFVGDAAGRVAVQGRKKDHSSSDRDFAANVGIAFHTPEEFFLDDRRPREWERSFDPLDYVGEVIQAQAAVPETGDGGPVFVKKHEVEIVVFVGSPGSGKSTFYRTHLEPLGYARANQDTLKTRERCVRFARAAVHDERRPVAVDNTNADAKTRAVWVALAAELGVPVRCVWLQAPPELCRHNDAVRSMAAAADVWNPEARQALPGLAFEGYRGRFQEPRLDEGFEEIVPVPFTFSGDDDMRKVWTSYWT